MLLHRCLLLQSCLFILSSADEPAACDADASALNQPVGCDADAGASSLLQQSGVVRVHDYGTPPSELSRSQAQKSTASAIGKAIYPNRQGKHNGSMSSVFKFGVSHAHDHPLKIGKGRHIQNIQNYEVVAPHLTGLVLNIFSNSSTGNGGILLALEVPDKCGEDDVAFVEVDRTRCSKAYPCALRLPAMMVLNEGGDQPTGFRTRVIEEDDDYGTDVLEYSYFKLDYDGEVVVAKESYNATVGSDEKPLTRTLKFSLDAILAAGPLSVMPIVQNRTMSTAISMRIRQPDSRNSSKSSFLEGGRKTRLNKKLRALEVELTSYRMDWASKWRRSNRSIAGCNLTYFEVVADQLFPGEVELEVSVSGTGQETLKGVLVTTRVTWAEAEISFIDEIMRDHFGLFLDPQHIIHGLPRSAIKPSEPNGFSRLSNIVEVGYAMESWVAMAETGHVTKKKGAAMLKTTLQTLKKLQDDPNQFARGLFYAFYSLIDENGAKQFPNHTDNQDIPCGDAALLFSSMLVAEGWLKSRGFQEEYKLCSSVRQKMNFSYCLRKASCRGFVHDHKENADTFWAVPLIYRADTGKPSNLYNWNIWADEGGVVSSIVGLTGAATTEQYRSIVREQQRYSPCQSWQGVSVRHSAFFNSIYTLPTRSMVGFGTLFESSYYHEYSVRSVLPSFRAFQKLKEQLPADYIGPSDAMSSEIKGHPGKTFGSYAYWPPNTMYDCGLGYSKFENQCTWCKGIQYAGLNDTFEMIVPHGNMAAFLVTALMERSQFSAWLEDTKKLITDASHVHKPGYGLEVLAPARRTPQGGRFEAGGQGRGVWESLAHGYTILTMYEGLATLRRRYELAKKAGYKVQSHYEPPAYVPLSQFSNQVPGIRSRINELLNITYAEESREKTCKPSEFGPVPTNSMGDPSSMRFFVNGNYLINNELMKGNMSMIKLPSKATVGELKQRAFTDLRLNTSKKASQFRLSLYGVGALDDKRPLKYYNASDRSLFFLSIGIPNSTQLKLSRKSCFDK